MEFVAHAITHENGDSRSTLSIMTAATILLVFEAPRVQTLAVQI